MSMVSRPRRRYRAPLLVGGVVCGSLTIAAGSAGATLDPDRSSELAQAQFQVYLLTETDLRPVSITCTSPTPVDTGSDLVCYAIVNDRETVTAVASLEAANTYTFTALGKVGRSTGGSSNTPATPETPETPGPTTELDLAVDTYMGNLVGDELELESSLSEFADLEVTVDSIEWLPELSTLSVVVTTDSTVVADEAAWTITNTIAWAWEEGTPLRADGIMLQPRFEVIIDGAVYGTPYEVMVEVADYDIGPGEWLDIVTNAAGLDAGVSRDARFAERASGSSRQRPAPGAHRAGHTLAIQLEALTSTPQRLSA